MNGRLSKAIRHLAADLRDEDKKSSARSLRRAYNRNPRVRARLRKDAYASQSRHQGR